MKVKINSFYHKALAFAGSTRVPHTPEIIREMVEKNLDQRKPGDKPGTWLVPLDPTGFKTPTLTVTADTEVCSRFVARREGEQPFLETYSPGAEYGDAASAQAVIYEVPVLVTDHEREMDTAEAKGESGPSPREFYEEGDHEFEVVIVKAPADEPGGLAMMVRNQMILTGGSAVVYTTEEWLAAVYHALTTVKVG